MELNITEKFDNKLLHRKEVKGWIAFSGATPSNNDVRLQVATQLNTVKELVVIDHIYNTYGAQEAKIFAKAYEKETFLKKYEPQPKPKKKKAEGGEAPAEGAPAEGKPAGGKPAEKPAEGKPEEGKPPEAKPPEEKPPEEKPAEDKPKEEPVKEQPAPQSAPEAKGGGGAKQ